MSPQILCIDCNNEVKYKTHRPSRCKSCAIVEHLRQKAVNKARTKERLRRIKLATGCKLCGYKGHHATLEFHHRNPKLKRFGLGELAGYSWRLVSEELLKCDILCSNCHRVLEFNLIESTT